MRSAREGGMAMEQLEEKHAKSPQIEGVVMVSIM